MSPDTNISRRSLLQGLAAFVFGVRTPDDSEQSTTTQRGGRSKPPMDLQLPSSVAGVRLIDSDIAQRAAELTRSVSPPYLFNHAVRTFLFGSLIGKSTGRKVDQEILYLACILHDLGLTEQFSGDLPFEIQGAEAAKHFLLQHGYANVNSGIVWDAIAMHASMLGQFKQPEIALVGEGAGADVLGPDPSQVSNGETAAILDAFPRLHFKVAFVQTCAHIVEQHPHGASRSFMRDIGTRYVSGFQPPNICDLIAKAPFEE